MQKLCIGPLRQRLRQQGHYWLHFPVSNALWYTFLPSDNFASTSQCASSHKSHPCSDTLASYQTLLLESYQTLHINHGSQIFIVLNNLYINIIEYIFIFTKPESLVFFEDSIAEIRPCLSLAINMTLTARSTSSDYSDFKCTTLRIVFI